MWKKAPVAKQKNTETQTITVKIQNQLYSEFESFVEAEGCLNVGWSVSLIRNQGFELNISFKLNMKFNLNWNLNLNLSLKLNLKLKLNLNLNLNMSLGLSLNINSETECEFGFKVAVKIVF